MPPACAQDHPAVERGFAPDNAYQLSDLDQVNLMSGGLSLRIPIGGSYPAGGSLSYSLTLTYASKLWDFEEGIGVSGPWVRSRPAAYANAGFGWALHLGRLLPPDDPSNETTRWQYIDPHGGRHGFYTTLHPSDPVNTGYSYTRDSTYIRMHELTGGQRTLEFPDGTIHTFSSTGQFEKLEDRHGNYLDVTYPSSTVWKLTDRQGRIHRVYFKPMTSDGASVMVVDRVELAAFAGTTATYSFEHQTASIRPACTDTFHSQLAMIDVPLLTKVTLPDGSTYAPAYHLDGCSWGLLESLTLPTLGRIDYTYGFWDLPTEGCDEGETNLWAKRTEGVTSRAFIAPNGTELGRWSYAQTLLGPPSEPTGLCTGTSVDPSEVSRTTVTTPVGHVTKHYFSVWPNITPAAGSPNGFKIEEYGLPFDRTQTDATGNRFLSSEVFDCSGATCELQRSIYVRYDYERPCGGNESQTCEESNRRMVSQRTFYNDDNRYADVDHSNFDGLGHYRASTTGGDFPSGNVRASFTNFNPGRTLTLDANYNVQAGYSMWPVTSPWVINTYTEQTVTEGGQTAKSQACFDSTTGFLKRVRTMKGTTPNANDLIAVFTPGATTGDLRYEAFYGGDVQSVSTSSDLCGLTLPVSQYRLAHTYSSGSLATTRYTDDADGSVGFVSVELTIDPNTGLASSSKDPAGIVTNYEYDAMGRLLWEKPENGHGAWTQYAYTRATLPTSLAKVQVLRRANGSQTGTILSQEEVAFDGLGRVWKERRLLPGLDWVMRETLYDAAGQKSQVAEWADEDASPFVQHWTKYLDHDPFGRPRTIRPPDGSAHDVTLIYSGDRVVRRKVKVATTQTSETTSEMFERYDRQGRLYQVVEPSGAGGADVTTTYSYDVGNRLTEVRTPSGSVTQIRTFDYDNRGFLLSEDHVEKDGVVTYSGYDARGHATRKIDGANDLTFVYDRAERLTEIKETTGARRPWKSFVYASDNTSNNWRKGKLLRAKRYNYYEVEIAPTPDQIFADGFECGDISAWTSSVGIVQAAAFACETIAYDVLVEESYTYGGVGGRVSDRDLSITVNGSTGETFSQSWTYTELGAVSTVGYPRCTFTRCTEDGAESPRNVTSTYTRGYLTAVNGYASSITYHPSSLANTITHTNGVVVTHGVDPNGMARPASITARKGATTLWSTGTYQYDGAGNITDIGTSWFTYDLVSRLTAGAVSTVPLGGGTLKQQSYTYDAFGNIQNIAGSPGRSTPTDSATNRIQGSAVYDASGNLTAWNGNLYDYDAFNMMTRFRSGSEDWLYVYTADDERVWMHDRPASAVFHRYTLRDLSAKVLREYTATGDFWTVAEDYVYRGSALLAAETPAGQRYFYLDHLGTPRLITDAIGQQTAYHVYFPFGEEATSPSQDQERMKFTGHERDLANLISDGDDLDYMHARFCSPNLGRFTSTDPVGGDRSSPQTWNLYTYSLNNPVRYVDPDGELAFAAIVAIAVVVGILSSSDAANAPTSEETTLIPSDEQGSIVLGAAIGAGVAIVISEAAAYFLEEGLHDQLTPARPCAGDCDDSPEDVTPERFDENPGRERRTRERGDRFTDDDDPIQQLEELENAQRRVRQGKSNQIIDSIEKSKQRVKRRLREIRNPEDVDP